MLDSTVYRCKPEYTSIWSIHRRLRRTHTLHARIVHNASGSSDLLQKRSFSAIYTRILVFCAYMCERFSSLYARFVVNAVIFLIDITRMV